MFHLHRKIFPNPVADAPFTIVANMSTVLLSEVTWLSFLESPVLLEKRQQSSNKAPVTTEQLLKMCPLNNVMGADLAAGCIAGIYNRFCKTPSDSSLLGQCHDAYNRAFAASYFKPLGDVCPAWKNGPVSASCLRAIGSFTHSYNIGSGKTFEVTSKHARDLVNVLFRQPKFAPCQAPFTCCWECTEIVPSASTLDPVITTFLQPTEKVGDNRRSTIGDNNSFFAAIIAIGVILAVVIITAIVGYHVMRPKERKVQNNKNLEERKKGTIKDEKKTTEEDHKEKTPEFKIRDRPMHIKETFNKIFLAGWNVFMRLFAKADTKKSKAEGTEIQTDMKTDNTSAETRNEMHSSESNQESKPTISSEPIDLKDTPEISSEVYSENGLKLERFQESFVSQGSIISADGVNNV